MIKINIISCGGSSHTMTVLHSTYVLQYKSSTYLIDEESRPGVSLRANGRRGRHIDNNTGQAMMQQGQSLGLLVNLPQRLRLWSFPGDPPG